MLSYKADILVVDDDSVLRLSLSIVLKAAGYRVRTAEDGFSALVEIKIEQPDILVSDLNMPRMSGFELLSIVRRRFPSIQVVAMSGGFSGSEKPPGIAADMFHRKGFGAKSLLETLEVMSRPDQPPLDRAGHVSPIWIPRIVPDANGLPSVTLTCPECLRTFPQVVSDIEQPVHETDCLHCSSMVPYAVVQDSQSQNLRVPNTQGNDSLSDIQ